MFIIGKIIGAVLMPPGLFILLFSAALLLNAYGRKRQGAWLAGIALLFLTLFSLTPFANALISPLETVYRPYSAAEADAASADIPIVVLGGGFLRVSPGEGGFGSLMPESTARAVYGAQLARLGKGPLCFTGGSIVPDAKGETEADAARRLWVSLGLDPLRIKLEKKSLDTFGNATLTRQILGHGPVLLVTSAWHMPRAMLAFRRAGVVALAAPCAYKAERGGYGFADWLPNVSALQTTAWAIHEYVGLAWYAIAPLRTEP